MSRRRFYAPPDAFNFHARRVELSTDEARHLREVLRLKAGDGVRVFDGVGHEYSAIVEKAMRDSAVLEIDAEVEPSRPESGLHLTLALALLKGDKFDLVVQKATELGVTEIVPVVTKFADIRLRDSSDAARRVARWQRIALEAAKQSGRASLPQIHTPVEFRQLIADRAAEFRIMFAERGGKPLSTLRGTTAPEIVTALIGSEGGWSDEEINSAKQYGWHMVTVGGRVLRTETAGIVFTALLQHVYGDLK